MAPKHKPMEWLIESIAAKLKNSANLACYVGSRVHHSMAPEDETRPYIVFHANIGDDGPEWTCEENMEIPTQEELDTARRVLGALIEAMREHEPDAVNSIRRTEAGLEELPLAIEEWPGPE